jgi:hypothetical protein
MVWALFSTKKQSRRLDKDYVTVYVSCKKKSRITGDNSGSKSNVALIQPVVEFLLTINY